MVKLFANQLIRLSEKFYPNDRFGKTIIKLNKEKVGLLFNALFDIFLWKTVTLNMIFLQKSKELVARPTSATTSHGNCYVFLDHFADMRYLIKLFINSEVFHNKPGNSSDDKKFKDLYVFMTTTIISLVPINHYKKHAWGNQNFIVIGIGIVNVYDNDFDQVTTLESNVCFLDFEDNNDNVSLFIMY